MPPALSLFDVLPDFEAAGQTITQHFPVLENQVVELATQATARMLGSVLTEDLQKRSIAELERVVRSAIDDREALRIRVSGSPALWEALKAGLGEKASHVDFAEAPGFDISVTIDEELSWRCMEDRFCGFHDRHDVLLPGHVAHQRYG